MADLLDPKRLLLLLGLSLFFGLAFEGFYHGRASKPPGGVRTFPLLGLLGAGLYAIDPHQVLGFVAGLLLLGAWLLVYYRKRLQLLPDAPNGETGSGIMAPVCNVVAYLLGPIALLAAGVVLLAVFGSVLAAGLPVVIALVGIGVAIPLIGIAAHVSSNGEVARLQGNPPLLKAGQPVTFSGQDRSDVR